jgi:hypothetical protein
LGIFGGTSDSVHNFVGFTFYHEEIIKEKSTTPVSIFR